MSEAFCSDCREVFRQIEDGKAYGELRPRNLEGTARSGCYLCICLIQKSKDYDTNEFVDLELNWDLEISRKQDEDTKISVFPSSRHRISGCELLFTVPPRQLVLNAAISDRNSTDNYQAPANTSHSSLANLVRSWLRVCLDEHSGPITNQDNNYRPPRLLHIDSGSLRLIQGFECPQGSDWATLSHCWGPHPTFLTLTSTNKSQFELGIPLDSLARTFRDAVKFCDSIGVNYLWIDSLCIIQQGSGSKEDWFHHMTEMRRVYQNATLNLAADRASSAEDGIFSDRVAASIQQPVIELHKGPMKGCWQMVIEAELLDLFSRSPLSSRAWVTQERIFSPRIVSFSEDQVYWSCDHGPCFKSERFPEGYPTSVALPRYCKSLLDEHKHETMSDMSDLRQDSVSQQFFREVCGYSSRILTYPDSDKFAAFSGIAEEYSRFIKEDYIAGFFRSHLPVYLTWKVRRPIPPRINRTITGSSYRAPSWSWAAIDNEVYFPRTFRYTQVIERVVDLLEVTDTCVELVDPQNKFGPLVHASLKLHAILLECLRDSSTEDPDEMILKLQMEVTASVSFDSIEDSQSDLDDVRLMPLAFIPDIRPRSFNSPSCPSIEMLVLRRVQGSNSPVYIRIGAGLISDNCKPSCIEFFESLPREEIELV
jgi:hypothetical protein